MKNVDLSGKRVHLRAMNTLSPEQCRAARAWLDWSQADLADRANVGLSTVRDFEKGRRTPIGNNLSAMRRAIEAEGIQPKFGSSGKALGITLTGSID